MALPLFVPTDPWTDLIAYCTTQSAAITASNLGAGEKARLLALVAADLTFYEAEQAAYVLAIAALIGAAGGDITGSIAATQVAVGAASNQIAGSGDLRFSGSANSLTGLLVTNTSTGSAASSTVIAQNDDGDEVIIGVGGSGNSSIPRQGFITGPTNFLITCGSIAGGVITQINNLISAYVASLFTAKGQILVGAGAGTFGALGVGANTNVLTADSTQSSGMKWAAPAAGASGAILQCLSVAITGNPAFSSASPINVVVPGMTLTLAALAKSTNKIRITVSCIMENGSGANYSFGLTVRANGTLLNGVANLGASTIPPSSYGPMSFVYVFAPGSAASWLYELMFISINSATANLGYASIPIVMTVEEINV